MSNDRLSRLERPAVQGYLSMLQGIINRMAGNSASCKTWTVTLVTALLALQAKAEVHLSYPLLCLIPIVLLYLLDCYYLGLGRITIRIQTEFLRNLGTKGYIHRAYKLKRLANPRLQLWNMMKAAKSFSTTPFYLFIALIVLALGWIF